MSDASAHNIAVHKDKLLWLAKNTQYKGMIYMKKLSLIPAALMLLFSVACGNSSVEYTYDSNSLFPEDYQTSYTKLSKYDCTKSAQHGGDYVKIWLSPEIKPSYDDENVEAPEGAVAVKEQFSDDKCEDLTSMTVMEKKEASTTGYSWQRLYADGSVEFTVDDNFCSSCHAAPPCKNNLCAF